jgi:hypothetical protein
MSTKLVLSYITAQQALTYKQQLTEDGLTIGHDYVWRYQPVKYNSDWGADPIEESQVEFEFQNPSLASFYRIKWAK